MTRLGSTLVMLALVGASVASCKTIGVRDVYTSIDADGQRRRATFYTDTTAIYCIVELANGRQDATLEVEFHSVQRYDFSKKAFVDGENALVAGGDAKPATGTNVYAFQFPRPLVQDTTGQQEDQAGPYFAGQYSCEVYVEGKREERITFNVLAPEGGCPVGPAVPGRLCIGFYNEGIRCPGILTTEGQAQLCTCSATKGWECVPK